MVNNSKTLNRKINWRVIVSCIIVIISIIFIIKINIPSEEELCADATIEAKSYLYDFGRQELADWWANSYSYATNEYIVSYAITNTDCDVWDRDQIYITFRLYLTTSNERQGYTDAIIEVYDGYAESIEFQHFL